MNKLSGQSNMYINVCCLITKSCPALGEPIREVHKYAYVYIFMGLLCLPDGAAVKNPPAVQESWVQFLGREDPLEREMASPSSILASEISWTEEPTGLQLRDCKRDTT